MRKIWMVAAATTTVFMLSAQDGAVETQGIGVIIDAHTPSITLSADRESVDISQADLDGTPLSLQLESFARPVFSGIGNVNQLFVQLSIQGAQVSQHVGETLYTIQWQLVSGGCLVP